MPSTTQTTKGTTMKLFLVIVAGVVGALLVVAVV
jgi:hypothetical protein